MQTNSIANAFTGVVKINPLIPGIVVTVLAYLVNIGGMKRLADASSIIVPFMVVTYFVVVVFIITTIIVCTLTAMAILMTGSLKAPVRMESSFCRPPFTPCSVPLEAG